MQYLKNTLKSLITATLLAAPLSAFAVDYTWSGAVDTDYATAGNWSPAGTPNLNGVDNAEIGGTAVYNPGGDFILGGGSTLTITNGGSWEQVVGGAWIQAPGGGILDIQTGGSFDTGSAGQINFGATGTSFNVGGHFTLGNTTLAGIASGLNASTFDITSGGLMTSTAEFKWGLSSFSINGGTLTVFDILGADAAGSQIITLNSGSVNIFNIQDRWDGFFSGGGDDYINFTSISGSVFIDNIDSIQADSLLSSRIRFNDVADSANFTYTAQDNGFVFAAIPEPGTLALSLVAIGTLFWFRRRS